jgi:type II secretory pathway pseudopilin PulG
MHQLEPQLMNRTRSQAGFTLIELLLGAFLTGVALTAVATVAIGHIRVTDRTLWTIQLRRDLSRLNSLLTTEAAEACIFRSDTDPTSCTPPATTPCTGTAGTDLRMGVAVSTAGVPVSPPGSAATPVPPHIVRYYLGTGAQANQLRRIGPPILASGRLSGGTAYVDSLVLDGVDSFTPTVAADCRSVTIAATLQIPNSTDTRASTLTLVPGVTQYIN